MYCQAIIRLCWPGYVFPGNYKALLARYVLPGNNKALLPRYVLPGNYKALLASVCIARGTSHGVTSNAIHTENKSQKYIRCSLYLPIDTALIVKLIISVI